MNGLENQFGNAEVSVWDLRKPGRENVRQFIKRHNRKSVFFKRRFRSFKIR